ncbi:hypothetical protein ABMA58_00220 [Oceanospirillum sp. HFRX-1_2]
MSEIVMDIYSYSSQTGEFLKALSADKDPKGDGYLMPSHTTSIAPPVAPEHQVAVFDEESWQLVPDYRGTEYWMPTGQCFEITQLGIAPPVNALFEPPVLPSLTVYSYHMETLEYTGPVEADPDPMAPGEYLVPAQATRVEPPATGEHQVAVFVGDDWEIRDDYRGTEYWLADRSQHQIKIIGEVPPEDALYEEPPEPQKPLLERKEDLKRELDEAADAARARFVSPGALIDKEYELALKQANEWLAAGMPSPVPSAVESGIAASGGVLTAEQAAQEIVDTAAAWDDVLLRIRAQRLAGKAAVNAAGESDDLQAVAQEYFAQLEAIKPEVV